MTTNKEKKIKALFIFPPTWNTFSISTGIPQIMGYLSQNGYKNFEALDLNIKFHHFFYKKSRLKKIFDDIRKERNILYNSLFFDKTGNTTSYNQKKLEYETLNNYLKQEDNLKDIEKTIKFENIKKAGYKTKENYTHKIRNSYEKINTINNIISYLHKNYKEKKFIYYQEQSKKFFEKAIEKIIKNNYNLIGFSINYEIQFEYSVLITKILREKGYKGHITFGGSHITTLTSSSIDLFRVPITSAIYGPGEIAIKELIEHIEGKRKVADVSNLIYLDKEKNIIKNDKKYEHIANITSAAYSGFNFKEYTSPETILPIRTSTGCYWGNCTFCSYNVLSKFKSRNIDDVINEIKTLIKKYKVNNFYFVDAALSPKFLDEFSKKIIEQSIEIYYYTNLRFEDIYTKDFLQRLYDSGLRCVGWGFESGSPRILKLMNKGTTIETTQRILMDAHEIGILNHLYYICGFPTETKEDFDLTINFAIKNKELIVSTAAHYFQLITGSYIHLHMQDFGFSEDIIKEVLEKRREETHIPITKLSTKININYYNKRVDELDKIFESEPNGSGSFETLLLASKYMSLKKEKKNFWSKLFK